MSGCGVVGVTIGPDEVLVQVGAADAAPEHLDEDLVGVALSCGDVDVLDADVGLVRGSVLRALGSPRVSVDGSVSGGQVTRLPACPRTWL